MRNPLLSVVVPVYKVEKVLERCLDSLLVQSMTEIEILLIDDASPDRCGEICKEYAEKDKRITVLRHSVNKGLSAARNLGIQHASCNWLMFVDSDDYVHVDFCKAAYECAVKYQADLVMFNRIRVMDPEDAVRNIPDADPAFSEGYLTRQEAIDLMLTDGGNAAWNKLYRRELFAGISYPEGYLYEDTGATYKLVAKASRVYYLNKGLYYHCYRIDSITARKTTKKELKDRSELNSQRYRDLVAWGYQSERLEYRIKKFALWYLQRKKRDMADPDYVFLAKRLVAGEIPKGVSWKERFAVFLFRFFPSVFDMICSFFGKKIA